MPRSSHLRTQPCRRKITTTVNRGQREAKRSEVSRLFVLGVSVAPKSFHEVLLPNVKRKPRFPFLKSVCESLDRVKRCTTRRHPTGITIHRSENGLPSIRWHLLGNIHRRGVSQGISSQCSDRNRYRLPSRCMRFPTMLRSTNRLKTPLICRNIDVAYVQRVTCSLRITN